MFFIVLISTQMFYVHSSVYSSVPSFSTLDEAIDAALDVRDEDSDVCITKTGTDGYEGSEVFVWPYT